MAYGSAAGVAALSSMWTGGGEFKTTTKPTLAQVTEWLTQVSSLIDTAIADEGFTTPVTDTDLTPEINLLVNGIVKDLVDYSRKAGRFYSKQALDAGTSPFMTIDEEIQKWVQRKTIGFEAQGLTRLDDIRGRSVASFDLL